MAKTALNSLQDQIEEVRREAFAAGYAAAMQEVRELASRSGPAAPAAGRTGRGRARRQTRSTGRAAGRATVRAAGRTAVRAAKPAAAARIGRGGRRGRPAAAKT